MHIVFVSPEYATAESPRGGLANYLAKIAPLIATRGHRVSVLSLASQASVQKLNGLSLYFVKRFQPPFISKLSSSVLGLLINSKRLALAFRQLQEREEVDIVQTSNFEAPALFLRLDRRIPLICRISSNRTLHRTSVQYRHSINLRLQEWLERRQIQMADRLFAPSLLLKGTLEKLQLTQNPIHLIRTPLPTIATHVLPAHGLPNDYFLFLGSMNDIKGADLILDVLANFLKAQSRFSFVFVGPAIRNCIPKLLNLMKQFPTRVVHFQTLGKDQVWSVLKSAYCLVSPSRVDNYPNAVLEAQSMHIPVIGSDRSSIDEMITDKVTGYIFENGNASSLLEKLLTMASISPEEYGNLCAQVRDQFDRIVAEDRIGQLIQFYEQTLRDLTRKKAA